MRARLRLGKPAVAERTRALATRLKDGLAAISAVRLLVRSRLERAEGVINVVADQPLPPAATIRSRYFR